MWNITIPVGSVADVYVPLLGADATKVTIAVDGCSGASGGAGGAGAGGAGERAGKESEGDQPQYCSIWAGGTFRPGAVVGVSAAAKGDGGGAVGDDNVVFNFESGHYSIVLTDVA